MTMYMPSLSYTQLFDKVKATLPGSEVAVFQAKRQDALAYFVQKGFPKVAREEWKYTRLGMFIPTPIPIAVRREVTEEMLAPFIIEGLDCYRMVFVNGLFEAGLSDNMPEVKNMASVVGTTVEADAGDEMGALNLAFMTDGLTLVVPKNMVLDKPIYALFITTEGASYVRNKIVLEEGSKAVVIEGYGSIDLRGNPLSLWERVGVGANLGSFHITSPHPIPQREKTCRFSPSMLSVATDITLKPYAALEHYTHQQTCKETRYIATTRANLDKGSRYINTTLTTGGKLSRHAIETNLNGEGASVTLHGIYLGTDTQHFDHYLPVCHHAPGCFSEQHYKGVLDGQAKGIFYGKVRVKEGAQKTDARQSNHHLLLSEHAMAYSRPELEIHADNVKCSHGSATGNIDKEALFYLRSRGIGAMEAQSLLVEGFVKELLEDMPQPSLKQHWQGVLHLWLSTS